MNGELVPLSRVTLLLERTVRDLLEITSAQDAQDLVDRVAAIRDLARRAKAGVDVENRVTALRVKAEMRLAELVDEGQERGEIATQGNPNRRSAEVSQPATLSDLGIAPQRLAEARALNRHFSPAVIDGAAADATERGGELTRRSLLSEAMHADPGLPDARTDADRYTAAFEGLRTAIRVVGERLDRIELAPADRDAIAGLLDGCRRRIGPPARLEAVR